MRSKDQLPRRAGVVAFLHEEKGGGAHRGEGAGWKAQLSSSPMLIRARGEIPLTLRASRS